MQLANFPARITGRVIINMRALQAAHHLGRANAFRADQGQPITIDSIAKTGLRVTINSPLGGTLTIGKSFRTGSNVVVLSGPEGERHARRQRENQFGRRRRADLDWIELDRGHGRLPRQLDLPRHTVIPPKAIYVNNKFLGYVSW